MEKATPDEVSFFKRRLRSGCVVEASKSETRWQMISAILL